MHTYLVTECTDELPYVLSKDYFLVNAESSHEAMEYAMESLAEKLGDSVAIELESLQIDNGDIPGLVCKIERKSNLIDYTESLGDNEEDGGNGAIIL